MLEFSHFLGSGTIIHYSVLEKSRAPFMTINH